MKRKRSKKYSKLDSILEIPREVASSDIKITILAFDELLSKIVKNLIIFQLSDYIFQATYLLDKDKP